MDLELKSIVAYLDHVGIEATKSSSAKMQNVLHPGYLVDGTIMDVNNINILFYNIFYFK
jgi:hypothetical protein